MKACFIALVASFTCLTSATSQTSKTSHTSKASKTCILFTGDILLDRGVRTVIDKRGPDHLFSRSMDSLFKASQVVVGNLECPATNIKAPVQKRFIFRAEPEWLTVLRKHGFTHLNLANNHAIDQGRQGLIDTKENIRKTNMTPIGAGYNMKEAAQPVLLTDKPRKADFAYLATEKEGPTGRGHRFATLGWRAHAQAGTQPAIGGPPTD